MSKRRKQADPARILQDLEALAVPLAELRPDPKNARVHDAQSLEAIRASLEAFGQAKPIVCLEDGTVVAGNGVLLAAQELGWGRLARVVFEDRERAQAFAIADNRVAELSYFDASLLREALAGVAEEDIGALGFSTSQLSGLLAGLEVEAPRLEDLTPSLAGGNGNGSGGELQGEGELEGELEVPSSRVHVQRDEAVEAVPEVSSVPRRAKRGDVWKLGEHVILCGDSTGPVARALFKPEALLTDPPYCSGGWQQAAQAKGSAGGGRALTNDNLSTRGYQDLIRRALRNYEAPVVYVFTDWRMWINLWDAVESSGYGIRQMIVWDKMAPGAGLGWRAQHELIMFGVGGNFQNTKFDRRKMEGNVIQAKRSGNKHHTTEKPVELLEKIIRLTDFAGRWLDPFLGSGSTVLAAERAGVPCDGCELDPGYVDVAIYRWEQLTGNEAERLEEGK